MLDFVAPSRHTKRQQQADRASADNDNVILLLHHDDGDQTEVMYKGGVRQKGNGNDQRSSDKDGKTDVQEVKAMPCTIASIQRKKGSRAMASSKYLQGSRGKRADEVLVKMTENSHGSEDRLNRGEQSNMSWDRANQGG